MIITGDVSQFALECIVSSKDSTEGQIFIIVENKKYGSKCGDFCLNAFFNNIKYPLSIFNPVLPVLYDVGVKDIFKSIDAVRNDTCVEECPINSVVEGYFDDPSDVHNKIIFYGGDYAFDDETIVLTSNGEKSHLMLRDEEDKRVSETTINVDEFRNKFTELEELYRKKIREHRT